MALRLVISLAMIATALSFSLSSKSSSRSSMMALNAMTDLPGAVAPLGFFDPAGIYI